MRFNYNIVYVPGKEHSLADALSRKPIGKEEQDLHAITQVFVDQVIKDLPVSNQQLERNTRHQREDETCQLLFRYCSEGWPEKVQGTVKHCQPVAAEISVQNGLLMRGCRIIIPLTLRMEMIEKLHTGHLGLVRCRQRARQSVWWPSLGNQLEELITNCSACRQHRGNKAEPL